MGAGSESRYDCLALVPLKSLKDKICYNLEHSWTLRDGINIFIYYCCLLCFLVSVIPVRICCCLTYLVDPLGGSSSASVHILKRRGGGLGHGTVGKVGVWHSRKGRGVALHCW